MTNPNILQQAMTGVTRVGPDADLPDTNLGAGPHVQGAIIQEAGAPTRHIPITKSTDVREPEPRDLLDTARMGGQSVPRSALTGEALVKYGNMEVKLSALEQMGVVVKGPQGYAMAEVRPAPTPAPQVEGPKPEAFEDAAAEEAAGALMGDTSPGTQAILINEYAKSGKVSETTIANIIRETGADPKHVQYAIDTVMGAFEAQAGKALAKYGDPEAVRDWAMKHRPEELKRAMKTHAATRTTSAYEAIGADYIGGLGDTPEGQALILNGNLGSVKARLVGNKVVVSHPTKFRGEMLWRDAVKAGLIKATMGGGK